VLITAPPITRPTPRIDATVQSKWAFDRRTGRHFYLFRLKVVGPPAGSAAQLRCAGRRCPFQSRRFTRIRRGAITLYKLVKAARVVKLKNRHFRARQTVQLRITAPGYIGKVVKYRLKRRKLPVGRVLCLPPGTSKPVKC
jgi:allantoicase